MILSRQSLLGSLSAAFGQPAPSARFNDAMIDWALLLGMAAGGLLLLWRGIVWGMLRQRMPGGWEQPEGWQGVDAQYVGSWLACLGMAGLSIAFTIGIHIRGGGGPTIEWSSTALFVMAFPGFSFYLLSGVVALVFGWRTRSSRWTLIGVLTSLPAIVGLVLYSRIWLQ